MKLRSLGLLAALALACAFPAAAQTAATLPVKDASSTTRNIAGQADAAGAFHYRDIMEGLTAAGAPDPFLSDGAGHQLVTLFGTPTFNLGTAPTLTVAGPLTSAQLATAALATSAKQDALLAALGSPLQAGGAVTVSGGATAANQTTANGSLSAIAAATGLPTDPKSTATDGTPVSQTALLKGQLDRLQAILTALGSPLQATGGSVAALGSAAVPLAQGNSGAAPAGSAVVYIGGRYGSADGVAPVLPADPVAGIDSSGFKHTFGTDTKGSLIPAGAAPAAAPPITSIAASMATAIRASAVPASIGMEIQTESANSAPIYICYQETTTCSATVHEDVIPVSTTLGAKLIPLFNWTGTVYAYSTAATSLRVNTWTRN